jgi:hypothetical protein
MSIVVSLASALGTANPMAYRSRRTRCWFGSVGRHPRQQGSLPNIGDMRQPGLLRLSNGSGEADGDDTTVAVPVARLTANDRASD